MGSVAVPLYKAKRCQDTCTMRDAFGNLQLHIRSFNFDVEKRIFFSEMNMRFLVAMAQMERWCAVLECFGVSTFAPARRPSVSGHFRGIKQRASESTLRSVSTKRKPSNNAQSPRSSVPFRAHRPLSWLWLLRHLLRQAGRWTTQAIPQTQSKR